MLERPLDQECDEPTYPLDCRVAIEQGLTKTTFIELWDYYHGPFLGYGEMGEPEYDDDTSNTDWRNAGEDDKPSALMLQARELLLSIRDRATPYEQTKIDNLSEKLTGWEEDYYDCEKK